MPRGFGRLPFLTRRSTSSGSPPGGRLVTVAASADPDAAPIGPPVLLPASITWQVLFDATELTPVWARPRPDPVSVSYPAVPAETTEPVAPKRPRRAPAGGSAKAPRTEATPRRTRRSDRSPKRDG